MKTWQMIKELTENPEKKFIRKGNPLEISVDDLYYLRWESGHDYINLEHEWKEVKEPITWQEAIQATIEGKTIIIEHNGRKYTQKGHEKIGCLHFKDSLIADFTGFNRDLFTEGKWYIED